MGVYINMEMPKETYAHCMLVKDIDGSVQLHVCTKNSEDLSEWEYYDLVPVPEPHGRMIDADELKKVIASAKHMDAGIFNGRLMYSDHLCVGADYDDVCKAIDETPTIIPTEPCKEKGE